MNRPTTDFNGIQTLMMGNLAFQAILECVRIGAFDEFEATPITAEDFAKRHGYQTAQTVGLLNLLVNYGLLEHTDDGYLNTPLASEHMVSTAPFYQGKSLELHNRFNMQIIADMPGRLKGQEEARKTCDDGWALRDSMDGTAAHAKLGALQDTVDFIAALPGFKDMRTMCDIGGNHGEFSMGVLERNPEMHGEIADLPQVTPTSNEYIRERGFENRLNAVPCDLRQDSLSEDTFDLILTSHVLYGFVDDLPPLLTNIYSSLKPGGWFVAQHLNPEGGLPREYTSAVDFCARMAGYRTHMIHADFLELALEAAGFTDLRSASAGHEKGGLIMAAQKTAG